MQANKPGLHFDWFAPDFRHRFVTNFHYDEGGEKGYANPPIRYDLLTKSALPFSP